MLTKTTMNILNCKRKISFNYIFIILIIIGFVSSCITTGNTSPVKKSDAETNEIVGEKEVETVTVQIQENYYQQSANSYSKAVLEEGCKDGIILYHYAYSMEQLEGLTPIIRNLYLQAWVRLKEQYPDHEYIKAAEEKME